MEKAGYSPEQIQKIRDRNNKASRECRERKKIAFQDEISNRNLLECGNRELSKQLDDARTTITERDLEVAALKYELASLKEEVASLKKKLDASETKVAGLTKGNLRPNAKLAAANKKTKAVKPAPNTNKKKSQNKRKAAV